VFTNNQWAPGTNDYDNAGNQTAVFLGSGATRGFTYDAEDRQITAAIPGMVAISYAYDGDGKRVQKTVGTTVTTYVYDAIGNLAAEYGPASPLGGTTYLTADHLGSTRLVTNSAGAPVARYDYAPFGEELTAGIDGRTTALLFSTNLYPTVTPDSTDQKFTGKERDAESGLDFFGARYMSSAQGRFTSPDEFKGGGLFDPFTGQNDETIGPLPYADISDPQTLNKYAYVRNNPLRYVDPDGHEVLLPNGQPVDQPNASAVERALVKGYYAVNNFAEQHPLLVVGAQVIIAIVTSEGGGATAGETPAQGLGDFHAPGDVPNATVIVRGGQSEMPAPGTTFSGSQGTTTAEAAAGVPHGQIRESTAGDIRAGGGNVEVKPEQTRSGTLNPKHVDVTEGKSTFGPVKPNPVPKKDRIE
jgi:RHS repeat-associated protein